MKRWTHPKGYMGDALIVAGPASCLFDDLERAIAILKAPRVMAINSAAAMLRADFVASIHYELMDGFAATQESAFGSEHFTTHAPKPEHEAEDSFPAVDYFWPNAFSPATSAWAGAMIGRRMGFERIVLCGCPMVGGDGYHQPTEPRLQRGFGSVPAQSPMVRRFQRELSDIVGRGGSEGIYSMSGFTREILGEPA